MCFYLCSIYQSWNIGRRLQQGKEFLFPSVGPIHLDSCWNKYDGSCSVLPAQAPTNPTGSWTPESNSVMIPATSVRQDAPVALLHAGLRFDCIIRRPDPYQLPHLQLLGNSSGSDGTLLKGFFSETGHWWTASYMDTGKLPLFSCAFIYKTLWVVERATI